MTIDLKSLRKLEAPSVSAQARECDENERILVLIKLHPGAAPPTYIEPRGQISDQLFSSEILAADLPRLEADPAVESISLSRKLAFNR